MLGPDHPLLASWLNNRAGLCMFQVRVIYSSCRFPTETLEQAACEH